MIEKLFLVRHGETVHNVAGIAQGWNDSELSANGVLQAERLAARLAGLGANALFSSPLGRAAATADVIRRATGLDVQLLEELKEMSYGRWEGRNFLDVRKKEPAEYERWIADPDCPCPEGESHRSVYDRMRRAFDIIARSANGRPLRPIVVTHGTAIRVGATALLDLPLSAARHLAQDNAALNIFFWRTDRFVLKLWNDAGPLSTSS